MRRFAIVLLLVLAGAAPAAAAEPLVEAPIVVGEFGPGYVIGPGDLLGIEVWKDPVLTRQVVVLPDGKISIPLIGEIAAGGKTVPELKKELETRLARYVPDAVITVEIRQLNSMHIYVLGRVNAPGRFLLTSNVNVLQALAIAGGPTPYANRSKIRVFRQEGGRTLTHFFDYDEVTAGRQHGMNMALKRGDLIFVP